MAGDALYRRALGALVPYEPGKPVEEVQRELGLDRVGKLASNEGQLGPFPAALEAIERGARELNRYPDGGAYRLRAALAAKHGVPPENVALAAGADGVIMYLSLATLDPGDEVVCGWPSFPSYVLGAIKMGARPVQVPLTNHRYDPGAILAAITPRTKLVYLCNPNNPTGTTIPRAEIDAYFESGCRVLVLRTFSKIYGLAGLRVGYGVGPVDVVEAIAKVRNAFDINQTAQDAAVASLGDEEELARRRRATAEGRAQLERALSLLELPYARPPAANFLYVETG